MVANTIVGRGSIHAFTGLPQRQRHVSKPGRHIARSAEQVSHTKACHSMQEIAWYQSLHARGPATASLDVQDIIVKGPPEEKQEQLESEGRCKTCGVPKNEIPWG